MAGRGGHLDRVGSGGRGAVGEEELRAEALAGRGGRLEWRPPAARLVRVGAVLEQHLDDVGARPRPTARSSSVRSSISLSASTAPASTMFIRWILSHSSCLSVQSSLPGKYSDLQSVQNALPSLQWHAHESSVFSSRPQKNNGSFSVRVTGGTGPDEPVTLYVQKMNRSRSP